MFLLLLSAKYLNLRKLFNRIHLQLPPYTLYRMDTFLSVLGPFLADSKNADASIARNIFY